MTLTKAAFITKCYRLMAGYTMQACMINAIQDIIERTEAGTISKANVKWINGLFQAAQ